MEMQGDVLHARDVLDLNNIIEKEKIMLKDGYVEHLVETKTPAGIVCGIVLGVVLILAGALVFPLTATLGFLIVVVGFIVFYFFLGRRGTEYEYIMVNDEVDIAKIVAKQKRKKAFSFSNSDVSFIAKSGSIYLDNEVQKNGSVKTLDFTSKKADNKDNMYVFVINVKGKPQFVKLELSDKVLDHVNNFFKGKYKE
jgi:hypothetical protein